jgi:hypothetical protein
MPKYFFTIEWGDRAHEDESGTQFPNDEAARAYAERIIRELKAAGGYDDPDLTMVVKTADGETAFSIPF